MAVGLKGFIATMIPTMSSVLIADRAWHAVSGTRAYHPPYMGWPLMIVGTFISTRVWKMLSPRTIRVVSGMRNGLSAACHFVARQLRPRRPAPLHLPVAAVQPAPYQGYAITPQSCLHFNAPSDTFRVNYSPTECVSCSSAAIAVRCQALKPVFQKKHGAFFENSQTTLEAVQAFILARPGDEIDPDFDLRKSTQFYLDMKFDCLPAKDQANRPLRTEGMQTSRDELVATDQQAIQYPIEVLSPAVLEEAKNNAVRQVLDRPDVIDPIIGAEIGRFEQHQVRGPEGPQEAPSATGIAEAAFTAAIEEFQQRGVFTANTSTPRQLAVALLISAARSAAIGQIPPEREQMEAAARVGARIGAESAASTVIEILRDRDGSFPAGAIYDGALQGAIAGARASINAGIAQAEQVGRDTGVVAGHAVARNLARKPILESMRSQIDMGYQLTLVRNKIRSEEIGERS